MDFEAKNADVSSFFAVPLNIVYASTSNEMNASKNLFSLKLLKFHAFINRIKFLKGTLLIFTTRFVSRMYLYKYTY